MVRNNNSLNCWKTLKLVCHNVTRKGKRDGAKAEKIYKMVYEKILRIEQKIGNQQPSSLKGKGSTTIPNGSRGKHPEVENPKP